MRMCHGAGGDDAALAALVSAQAQRAAELLAALLRARDDLARARSCSDARAILARAEAALTELAPDTEALSLAEYH